MDAPRRWGIEINGRYRDNEETPSGTTMHRQIRNYGKRGGSPNRNPQLIHRSLDRDLRKPTSAAIAMIPKGHLQGAPPRVDGINTGIWDLA